MLFEPISELIEAYWVFLAAAGFIGVATGWLAAAQAPNTDPGRQDNEGRQ